MYGMAQSYDFIQDCEPRQQVGPIPVVQRHGSTDGQMVNVVIRVIHKCTQLNSTHTLHKQIH
jgi:hypothetical protein